MNDWKRELQSIINRHNDRHAVKAKNVSFETMNQRANFLFAFFAELRRKDERKYEVLPSGRRGGKVHYRPVAAAGEDLTRWLKPKLFLLRQP